MEERVRLKGKVAVILHGGEVSVRSTPGEVLHADGEVRRFVGDSVKARIIPRAISVVFAP